MGNEKSMLCMSSLREMFALAVHNIKLPSIRQEQELAQ